MSKPFDYVSAINTNKNDLIRDSDNPELSERLYKPFLVNKALSYFPETLAHANIMNSMTHLDNILQNDFYLNSIRPGKRYTKWHKKEDNDVMDCIQEYYKVNYNRAQEIAKILTKAQIDLIKIKIIKGGNSNEFQSKSISGGETKKF